MIQNIILVFCILWACLFALNYSFHFGDFLFVKVKKKITFSLPLCFGLTCTELLEFQNLCLQILLVSSLYFDNICHQRYQFQTHKLFGSSVYFFINKIVYNYFKYINKCIFDKYHDVIGYF